MRLVETPKYDNETITCTYKNGVLTGPFKWGYYSPNNKARITTGTFTSDGKMTGKWSCNGKTYSFLNGVFLQSENYDANLKKLANSYCSKKITLEQLEAEHCVSSRSSTDLYPDISSVIVNKNDVDWGRLGEVLYYLPSLSLKLLLILYLIQSLHRHYWSHTLSHRS